MPRVVYTLSERIEMVKEHFQGISYRHIVDHFAAAHPDRPIPASSTVRRIVKSFEYTGNVDPAKKPKTTYPNRRLSEETKLNIFLAVAEVNGKKPLAKVAQELQVSKSSVYKTLRSQHLKANKVQEHEESEEDDDYEDVETPLKLEAIPYDDSEPVDSIKSAVESPSMILNNPLQVIEQQICKIEYPDESESSPSMSFEDTLQLAANHLCKVEYIDENEPCPSMSLDDTTRS